MKLVVAIEHHFVRVGNEVYTNLAFGYDYWKEYLQVYDEVYVLARVGLDKTPPQDAFLASGDGVKFIEVPDYLGPKQFFLKLPLVMKSAFLAIKKGDCFLLRSGNICTCLWLWLFVLGRPYAREVQGDIKEAIIQFTAKSGPRRGKFFAAISDLLAKIQVRRACCASYVSEHCKNLYPPKKGKKEFIFSSVQLTDDLIRAPRNDCSFRKANINILSVGRLEREKGHHVLVEALGQLKEMGRCDFKVRIVGPGREFGPLQRKISTLGLENFVELIGPVPYGKDLFAYFDWADLFILPSLTEGMPRSLIEAMAAGLPAIGTRAGGIVELLTENQLVPSNDAFSLAQAILRRLKDRSILSECSRINFSRATERYNISKMNDLKISFWKTLKYESGSGYE